MNRAMRWIVPVAGVAGVVVLFLVLRPGDDGSPSPASSPTAAATATASPTGATETQTPEPTASQTETPGDEGGETTIEIEVTSGRVEGPGEVEIEQGSRVELEVEADVADEVHVHGYDLFARVTPDRRAKIEFRATATGVFEVELEEAGLVLVELRIVP